MAPQPKAVSTKVYVETPEQIDFAFVVAGVGPRILAYLLDLLIRSAAVFIISIIVVILTGGAPFGFGVVAVLFFAVEWGYFTLIEWLNDGVTPGKKALGLRVVRTNGVSLDLYRSAMRNLLRAADGFPPLFAFLDLFPFPSYAVGMFILFVTGTSRRLGDLAADTMVVVEERKRLASLPQLPQDAMEFAAHQVAASGITAKEMSRIDAFFRRKRFFSPQRSEELAEVMASPLARKMNVSYDSAEAFLAGVLQGGYEERASYADLAGRMGGIS
ncbi:MAG: RDD family protein [Deltaproteobacteria bacterium]|nr:RDD family protein [Deltaproteobacteria bacterium]MBN2671622.1 RDD family protein [Deltaproteobacteria bacterium]